MNETADLLRSVRRIVQRLELQARIKRTEKARALFAHAQLLLAEFEQYEASERPRA